MRFKTQQNGQTGRPWGSPHSAYFPTKVVCSQGFPSGDEKRTRPDPLLEQFFPLKPASPHLPEKTQRTPSSAWQAIAALCFVESLGSCIVELVLVLSKMEHIDSEDLFVKYNIVFTSINIYLYLNQIFKTIQHQLTSKAGIWLRFCTHNVATPLCFLISMKTQLLPPEESLKVKHILINTLHILFIKIMWKP